MSGISIDTTEPEFTDELSDEALDRADRPGLPTASSLMCPAPICHVCWKDP